MVIHYNTSRWLVCCEIVVLLFCTIWSRTSFASFVGSGYNSNIHLKKYVGKGATTTTMIKSSASSRQTVVDQLVTVIQKTKKEPKTKNASKDQIISLIEQLEEEGSDTKYLDDPIYVEKNNNGSERGGNLLWDSYELAYFDSSIDGKDKMSKKGPPKFSKLLRPFFGLRYSFQHVVPDRVINDVGVKIFGIPVCILAGGNYTRISKEDANAIKNETGTVLKTDTTVRIDFEEPVLWLGNKRFPLILSLGSKGQSPPVTLCTTYMDNKLRLGLAAKGGRLVFTRGGRTREAFASDWEIVVKKKPLGKGVLGGLVVASTGAALKYVPMSRIPIGALATFSWASIMKRKISRKLS